MKGALVLLALATGLSAGTIQIASQPVAIGNYGAPVLLAGTFAGLISGAGLPGVPGYASPPSSLDGLFTPSGGTLAGTFAGARISTTFTNFNGLLNNGFTFDGLRITATDGEVIQMGVVPIAGVPEIPHTPMGFVRECRRSVGEGFGGDSVCINFWQNAATYNGQLYSPGVEWVAATMTTVPEPASWMLVGGLLLVILLYVALYPRRGDDGRS